MLKAACHSEVLHDSAEKRKLLRFDCDRVVERYQLNEKMKVMTAEAEKARGALVTITARIYECSSRMLSKLVFLKSAKEAIKKQFAELKLIIGNVGFADVYALRKAQLSVVPADEQSVFLMAAGTKIFRTKAELPINMMTLNTGFGDERNEKTVLRSVLYDIASA